MWTITQKEGECMSEVPEVVFDFWDINENSSYVDLSKKVIEKCFEIESIQNKNLYINVIFTVPQKIKEINKQYRNIDKETDVLSFPMLEKEEILAKKENSEPDTLGDIIISIEQVKKQAEEYGHGFERELSYMLVHGFYHLMGYDHIDEKEKAVMREKEEAVLSKIGTTCSKN